MKNLGFFVNSEIVEFLDYKNLQHTRKYVILEYAFSGTRMIHLYEVEEGIEFVS